MTTRKRIKIVPKVIASSSVYIDPVGCDSTVSYKVINGSNHVWGSVQLADCSRKIEWSFWKNDKVDKIDKAIETLKEFRTTFVAAQLARRKRAKRVKPAVKR